MIPETIEVRLSSLLINLRNGSRAKLKQEMVHRYSCVYKDSPELMPLIEVADFGKGLVLFDGFHRYEAMKKAGVITASVKVHKDMKPSSLPYHASLRNSTNGIPMSQDEYRKRYLGAYIRSGMNRLPAGKLKSYRVITKELGSIVDHTTIMRWIEKDHKATYEAMRKENPKSEIPMRKEEDPNDLWEAQAREAMGQLHKLCLLIDDPERRGRLLQDLELIPVEVAKQKSVIRDEVYAEFLANPAF